MCGCLLLCSTGQVAHLKQQLAAARAEVACLKKAMHGPGGGGGGVVQAALEELEGQVEEKQKELERKNVQLVSSAGGAPILPSDYPAAPNKVHGQGFSPCPTYRHDPPHFSLLSASAVL